jgi:biopolymer transport protein ExbB/TolQ
MKPRLSPGDFRSMLLALVAAITLVHALYALQVRPQARAIVAEQRARAVVDPGYVAPRSLYVTLGDYEQEIEIVLMLWATSILALQAAKLRGERREFEALGGGATAPASPATLATRARAAALARFAATGERRQAAAVAHSACEAESDRMDAELSMVRYVAWAIPAIGFIGSARGIGDALAVANRAEAGDISGVSAGLGVAFNATLLALLLSIVLMFLQQQLQRAQEALVSDVDAWLDRDVIAPLPEPQRAHEPARIHPIELETGFELARDPLRTPEVAPLHEPVSAP